MNNDGNLLARVTCWALVCAVGWGSACSTTEPEAEVPPPPNLSSITPAEHLVGAAVPIAISGENFIVKIARRLTGDQREFEVNEQFHAYLIASDAPADSAGIPLAQVSYVDPQNLTAMVPADVPLGVYHVRVTTPYELSGTLQSAYRVLPHCEDDEDCDDQIRCTFDQCDPQQGCQHQPLPAGSDCGICLACDDQGDCVDALDHDGDCPLCQVCAAGGQCANQPAGVDLKEECPDGMECRTGACDGQGSCGSVPVGAACTDQFPDDCGIAQCDGAGTCDQQHGLHSAQQLCRPANGSCDVAEFCDGQGADCPPDQLRPDTHICRAVAGACDLTERCDGLSSVCPPDQVRPDTTVCRPAVDSCDVEERCDGSSADCPADDVTAAGEACFDETPADCNDARCDGKGNCNQFYAVEPESYTCRPQEGECDVAEFCDGGSGACPEDAIRPEGAVCRSTAGECDLAEFCDGLTKICPDDLLTPPSVACRPAVDLCDVAEYCDGALADCPADAIEPATTVCRIAVGECDVEERCDGLTGYCPSDVHQPAGDPCADQTPDNCAAARCDETGACDQNHDFESPGYLCRPSIDDCDTPETCDGTSADCPADDVAPSTTVCRVAEGECDVAEFCDGIGSACPTDQHLTDMTPCDTDSGVCCAGQCETGECCADTDCDDGNECTDEWCSAHECAGVYNFNPCDDGEFCTETDLCTLGVCLGWGDSCPSQLCDELADSCVDFWGILDPFGDGTAFSFVFEHAGRVWLGPRQDGTGAMNMLPDGTDIQSSSFSFFEDVFGNSHRNSCGAPCPPYPSIGRAGCTPNTAQCGPDNENGRGLFASGTLGGVPWLVVGGARGPGDLDYVYLTQDAGSVLEFSYLDMNNLLGPNTRGISAMHVFNDQLYIGFPDTGGNRPYLILVLDLPSPPGVYLFGNDGSPCDPWIDDACNLDGTDLPGVGGSASTSIIDVIADFNDRLYVANNGGIVRATVLDPLNYDDFDTHWIEVTPVAAAYGNHPSLETDKTAELEPADKAVPAMVPFGGRLFVARNTDDGPQLWACMPDIVSGPTPATAVDCDPGDWQLVAPNSAGTLTQFNNSANTRITLLEANADFLYLGFNNTAEGFALFRTGDPWAMARDDFEGQGGCSAEQYPDSCSPIAGHGLGQATNTRIFDSLIVDDGGKPKLFLAVGDGTSAVRVYILGV